MSENIKIQGENVVIESVENKNEYFAKQLAKLQMRVKASEIKDTELTEKATQLAIEKAEIKAELDTLVDLLNPTE